MALGCGACLAGALGFWFQDTLIQEHNDIVHSSVEVESRKLFSSFLSKKFRDIDACWHVLSNYSGTHTINPRCLRVPASVNAVERLLREAQKNNLKIRPVGRYLSPNGLASSDGMLSLALCDKILHVDKKRKQVTVEPGVIIEDILKALKSYNMTLANFSSIKEQQIAGWTQVGAHGTGAQLPTVDEMVVHMKIATPNLGTLELSRDTTSVVDSEIFRLARCGLGSIGVITEMTLQCTDYHWLRETISTMPIGNLHVDHTRRLQNYRHLRYMWIPYTGDVVIVKSNPTYDYIPDAEEDNNMALKKLASLYRENLHKFEANAKEKIESLTFSQLRDRLLDLDPLETDYVKKINKAELFFWQNKCRYRSGPSDEILGFDCGGQQLVLEVAFPTGTFNCPTGDDLKFAMELKEMLETSGIPAPAPIEQRWTCASSSDLSPAFNNNPNMVYSWIGIIMYLPPNQDESGRERIRTQFNRYADILYKLSKKYGAVPHWAKIEVPTLDSDDRSKIIDLKSLIENRYNVGKFQNAMRLFDPKGILSNRLIKRLVGDIVNNDINNL